MATSPRVYPAKRHIGIDLETLSLSRRAAIIDIGAVVMMGGDPGLDRYFEIKIKPSEYAHRVDFDQNPATRDFHESHNPGYLQQCEDEGVTIEEAANRLYAWLDLQGQSKELHVWSQGKDFDFPIIEWLFQQCGYSNTPYKYRNVHCVRDLLWLNPAARIPSDKEAAHTALADVVWMAQQFKEIVARSTWYQKLFA